MIQALASGTIDVYVAGIAPLAVARSKGIDVRVVAATAVEEMVFVAGPKLAPYFESAPNKAEALRAFEPRIDVLDVRGVFDRISTIGNTCACSRPLAARGRW